MIYELGSMQHFQYSAVAFCNSRSAISYFYFFCQETDIKTKNIYDEK